MSISRQQRRAKARAMSGWSFKDLAIAMVDRFISHTIEKEGALPADGVACIVDPRITVGRQIAYAGFLKLGLSLEDARATVDAEVGQARKKGRPPSVAVWIGADSLAATLDDGAMPGIGMPWAVRLRTFDPERVVRVVIVSQQGTSVAARPKPRARFS